MSGPGATFLVIGAAKAGTTSLASYLKSHPNVCTSDQKEPHFFSWKYDRGVAWYDELFAGCRGATAVGEASTSYSLHPHLADVPKRIADYEPNMKLIYVVREPVARIRSQFAHNIDRGLESRPISDAIRSDPRYLDATRYAHQIRQYLEHFPSEQLKIVVSEQLRHERDATLATIFEFIGVDPSLNREPVDEELNQMSEKRLAPAVVNRGRRWMRRIGLNRLIPKSVKQRLRVVMSREMPSDVTAMSAEDEAWIVDQLREDLADLRGLVGGDFDAWGRL